jgi:replicative DNA helicase
MMDRLPPGSSDSALDAERSVLGAILIDSDVIIEVAEFLRPGDMYRQAHTRIYRAMLDLFERRQRLDVVTVAEALGSDLESVGGASYLSTLANETPTAIYAGQYARIVERKATMRALIGAAGTIAGIGYEDGSDTQEAIDRAQAALMAVTTRQQSRWTSLGELMPGAYEHLGQLHEHVGAILGVPSGFVGLDRLTGGFNPGELVIVAARPSVGKTALAIQMARYAAAHGHPTGLFSLEMSGSQLALRILSGSAGINTRQPIAGEAFERAAEVAAEQRYLPLWIDDTPTATPVELRLRARRLMAEHRDLGFLIVDYLQLAHVKAESREREVAEISRNLKALARELQLPVVALAQLNRQSEGRDSGKPRLSDLRDSGAIEQDADTVIFLWRSESEIHPVEAINVAVAKQRNGPLGDFVLDFHRARTMFVEQEHRYGEPWS